MDKREGSPSSELEAQISTFLDEDSSTVQEQKTRRLNSATPNAEKVTPVRKPVRKQELKRTAPASPTLNRPKKAARMVGLFEPGSSTTALVLPGTGPQTLAPTIALAIKHETRADPIPEGTNQASKPKNIPSATFSSALLNSDREKLSEAQTSMSELLPPATCPSTSSNDDRGLGESQVTKPKLLVSNLKPGLYTTALRIRVIAKTPVKPWSNSTSQGKVYSMTVGDESAEIRMVAFNAACDQIHAKVEVGHVYDISVFRVIDKQFGNPTREIHLSVATRIVHRPTINLSLPSCRFTTLDVIAKSLPNLNLPENNETLPVGLLPEIPCPGSPSR